MALWSEPQASDDTQKVYSKIRRFIVIKNMKSHSICIPIHTYSGQGTSKPGVKPGDHAPLVQNTEEVMYHALEKKEDLKMPLSLIVEDSTINFSPYSRICFSKPYSFEHNIKVRKIGRISPKHLERLWTYYREMAGILDKDTSDRAQLEERESDNPSGLIEETDVSETEREESQGEI